MHRGLIDFIRLQYSINRNAATLIFILWGETLPGAYIATAAAYFPSHLSIEGGHKAFRALMQLQGGAWTGHLPVAATELNRVHTFFYESLCSHSPSLVQRSGGEGGASCSWVPLVLTDYAQFPRPRKSGKFVHFWLTILIITRLGLKITLTNTPSSGNSLRHLQINPSISTASRSVDAV